MDLQLKGKTALVTGASKGIGAAVAACLAEEGVDLVLVARNAEALAQRAAGIAERHGVRVETFPCDLSDSANIDRLAAQHPAVDILVNNAGAIPRGTLTEVSEAVWRNAWDLKVFGYVNLCRAYYGIMKARGQGVIVNIIGSAGERMSASYITGSAGNAALMAFTRALGGRALDDGLRVVGINPGSTLTDRLEGRARGEAGERFGDPDRWQELFAEMPAGRPGRPEEIAWLTAFLASPRSAYTSGTIVTVDGGSANRN